MHGTCLVILILTTFGFANAERADVVVAKDGTGQFTTIQAAIESVAAGTVPVMILVKNGLYNEKLFIRRSNVTLVGEDRDSTRLTYAELRENWTRARNNRPDGTGEELDWGAAVINIGGGAADITIANMTIHNNYGTLYGNHDHQFTIRGFNATRIVLLDCNVISDGGDALALWNRESGMYYHNNCYFEGWVDYVCPRGWCYIVDSKFYGHNMSASIWHDGSANRLQKLVIRNSSFDGVPGFPLGRHHRDAQIYLIDCMFSSTMADRPIYSPKSPNTVPWVWGERHYFYNCHRDGGDYAWFGDNLATAEDSPDAHDITAMWTFDGEWDPEGTMASVLPHAFLPTPENGAAVVSGDSLRLDWVPGRNAESHTLYLGTNTSPSFHRTVTTPSVVIRDLEPDRTYYWRVDEITSEGTVEGTMWNFTTSVK